MTLCDLYLRLSDGRNENGSFADREKALRRKAKALRWTVHRVVIENDLMNGSKSASAFKRRKIGTTPEGKPIMRVWRPGFRSILDDIAAGRVKAILAEDLDRTMRDPRDAEDLIDVIRERNAYADSLSGSLRFTAGGTDAEVMMARIAVTVANKASADTARRVREGRERQAGKGIWGGGRRPYGFRPVPHPDGNHKNTELVVDDAEAGVIRRCADQVLAETFGKPGGNSLKSIARDLREREVPTVTGVRWTAESLRDVLVKPLCAGIVVYNGKETQTRLPGAPILDEDVWRAVVAKLTDPARSTPGRAPTWLGTNIYRCVCGYVMEIQRGRGRAPAYRCARPTEERTPEQVHVRRNAAQLDDYVVSVLIGRLSSPDAVDMLAQPRPDVDVRALRRQAAALRERKAKLSAMLGAGDMDPAEFATAAKVNREKLAVLEAKLAAVTETSPLAPIVGVGDVGAAWDRLSLGQQRAILVAVLVVTVLPTVRKGRGFDPATVSIEGA